MLINYVLTLIFTLIGTTFAQTSSTGKINSGADSSGASNSQTGPEVTNNGYQYNQGVQPYSYGYNTRIRPYSYSYTYPQNGGKPQMTYQNLQQPQPQPQFQGMVPMRQAYYGQNGYPPMQPVQPAYYGYPPMQPVQFQPMPMNGPQPTIPPMPESSLGGDFDLSNLSPQPQANNANNANSANANNQQSSGNPLSDFGLDNLGATNTANSNNNNANGLQPPDLNAELANLANPGSNGGNSNSGNNNNALPVGVPQGLADFGIEGLGSSPTSNSNDNNPMASLDILNQLGGGQAGQNDFADLTNLANLANGNIANGNPTPAQTTNTKSSASPNDNFNFGGSNNNLDFNINNLPSASNLDFDLNIPSPSELKPQNVKSDKEIATTKNTKQAIKKTKKDNQTEKPTTSSGRKLFRNRRSMDDVRVYEQMEQSESAQSLQNEDHLVIDPESPRGMLNIDPEYQNPNQGVYSQWPGYRL